MSKIICIPYGTKMSSEFFVVNVTSRAKSPFSPYLLVTSNGIVENIWQFSKVYPVHVDAKGDIKDDWYEWRTKGLENDRAVKNPMGKGAKPLFFMWQNKRLSYVEARKAIYIPVYSQAVLANVKNKFDELLEWWKFLCGDSRDLYLRDFDGYDRHKLNMSIDDVINCTEKHMGHSFVLEKMILDCSGV